MCVGQEATLMGLEGLKHMINPNFYRLLDKSTRLVSKGGELDYFSLHYSRKNLVKSLSVRNN